MKIRTIILLGTHLAIGVMGFAIGIYTLPIITAPTSPSALELKQLSNQAAYSTEFKKDLAGSDFLHWGEGLVSVGDSFVALTGQLSPGPDYKLYFSPEFVETEQDFERLKSSMTEVGDIKTFNNFVVNMNPKIDPLKYNTVIVWCESFDEFITSAKYR
jgi:hypothetical protein